MLDLIGGLSKTPNRGFPRNTAPRSRAIFRIYFWLKVVQPLVVLEWVSTSRRSRMPPLGGYHRRRFKQTFRWRFLLHRRVTPPLERLKILAYQTLQVPQKYSFKTSTGKCVVGDFASSKMQSASAMVLYLFFSRQILRLTRVLPTQISSRKFTLQYFLKPHRRVVLYQRTAVRAQRLNLRKQWTRNSP